MGLNVSSKIAYQFENQDSLQNTAKNILTNSGASTEKVSKIIEQTIFDNNKQIKELYTNPQLSVIKASTQISLNNSLKETLKYLKTHANIKKTNTPTFGELWNIFATSNTPSEHNPYKEELYDFKIDGNAKNIFAA